MAKCPRHNKTLIKVSNLSLACPRCDYKEYIKTQHWVPDVRNVIRLPSMYAWSTFTLTRLEVNGDGNLTLSSGQTTGFAVSPQISNISRYITRKKDITKAKIDWTHTLNDGKVQYSTANDGGTNYTILKTEDAIFHLNHGNEMPAKQAYYYDLRLKIYVTRDIVSDTSPVITALVLTHNYIT